MRQFSIEWRAGSALLISLLFAPQLSSAAFTMVLESTSNGTVSGYACNNQFPNEPVSIAVWLSSYSAGSSTTTGGSGGCTNNRFTVTIDRSIRSRAGPGPQPIRVNGLHWRPGVGKTSAHVFGEMTITGQKTPLSTLNAGVSNCRLLMDDSWQAIAWSQQGSCPPSPSVHNAWFIRGTNEDIDFENNVGFLPNDAVDLGPNLNGTKRPYFFYSFHPRPDGKFDVGLVIDKLNFSSDLAQYSAGMFNEKAFTQPLWLNKNIFIEMNIGLFGSNQSFDPVAGQAKNRSVVAVVANWLSDGGVVNRSYLEVNLFRTDNFDQCTETDNWGGAWPVPGPCDTFEAVYDRRNYWPSGIWGAGEAVYFNLSALHKVAGNAQNSLVADGIKRPIRIPISELFRGYDWQMPPTNLDWGAAEIDGVYIGHEVWGKGRVWTEFDSYEIYEFEAD